MQELQVIDEQKINRIYELITTEEFTRESFEKDLLEATEKYKGYIATASTLKDDRKKRAELNNMVKSKNRIRIDTKNILSETAMAWNDYARSIIKPFEDVVSAFDKSIKDIEEHQKALRLDTVKGYLANKAAEYMLDPRIFDEKALGYVKDGDFMADGVTLKKATMKSLDDMVTFEFQNQQEYEKAKAAISGQCAEYGMTDLLYLRMLQDMSLAEVLEQIKSDYLFQKQKEEAERVRREREQQLAEQRRKEQEQAQKASDAPQVDPETGEILDGGDLSQNQDKPIETAENSSKRYTQKLMLEIYFADDDEKNRFKKTLAQLGFKYMHNYIVKGYREVKPPLTQEKLEKQFKVEAE